MRTDLDHLPPTKRRELERVVQILFEAFGEATALATSAWKKQGRILKIILYGSHARGGWVSREAFARRSISSSTACTRSTTATQGERIDMRLVDVWPRDAKRERAMFEKLKAAYIKARYSKHYRINEDELTWLGARVETLGRAVETICSGRLEALEAAA
jgi:hypothetical protein